MNVLILENEYDRVRKFHGHFGRGDRVVNTDSVGECQGWLLGGEWDVLFLDHDLDARFLIEPGPGTGYELAEWLADHPIYQPPIIVIHSLNPGGAEAMQKLLPKAIIRPAAWNDRAFLVSLRQRA